MALTAPEGWRIEATHAEHTLFIACDGTGSLIVAAARAAPPAIVDLLREITTRFAPHIAFDEPCEIDGALRARARLPREYVEVGVASNGDVAAGYVFASRSPAAHAGVVDALVAAALSSAASPFAHWRE